MCVCVQERELFEASLQASETIQAIVRQREALTEDLEREEQALVVKPTLYTHLHMQDL